MLSNSVAKRRTLILACFGIVIGLCLGTVVKNYRALEIVKRCSLKSPNGRTPTEIIEHADVTTIYNSQRALVFVGVMTARRLLEERARTVYNTWGHAIPGRLAFFSSEGSYADGMPVIGLKNVDDRYPPQKKSFMMLYYMYEHFIDKFEWFMRADDDVYIEPTKLERFLRSIDSTKPQFIGQAGRGKGDEIGQLSLENDENFCMGGPGIIFSSETLRRVAPHIPTCLRNLYSTHEDVEIGRCVQKYAGIPCTWNYEMQFILRHNSSGYSGKLRRRQVHNAITLHPIKQAAPMYRLHAYMQGLKAEELRQQTLLLHRDIKRMASYLAPADSSTRMMTAMPEQQQHFEDHNILGITPDLNKFVPRSTADLLHWSFLSRSVYSAESSNPKQKIDTATRESLAEIAIPEIMEKINNYSRQRGRVIEFRELLYGYQRLNPLHGQDYILDLLLMYKRYRGKKMTVPVRRHLYAQRAFTGIFVREFDEPSWQAPPTANRSTANATFFAHVSQLAKQFTLAGKWQATSLNRSRAPANIVLVLPIAGRLATFKRFLAVYEKVAIRQDAHVDLVVVLFGQRRVDMDEHVRLLNALRQRHPARKLNCIERAHEEFSRGIALDTAIRSSYIAREDIMFFIDVDIVFKAESLQRIRFNTVRGAQVYLPIVFSQYDPERRMTNSEQPADQSGAENADIQLNDESGYFRSYGFGICGIYKSDMLETGMNGFDRNLTGWGLEDVKFLEELIQIGNRRNAPRLSIFRAPDPTLVHLYHEIECDVRLDAARYNMCLGTKANTVGSTRLIERLFYENLDNLRYIRQFNLQRVDDS